MPGWAQSDIIDVVSKHTENRADEKLDLNDEFSLALDEFCNTKRFWWRKKTFRKTVTLNGATVDFSAEAPDFGGQFHRVFLVGADGASIQRELDPLLNDDDQIAARLANTTDVPCAYFLDSAFVIRLQQPSSVIQDLFATYWAIPDEGSTPTETIPLVPPHLHYGLVYALERRVFSFLFGINDPRFTVAEKNYLAFVAQADRTSNFAPSDLSNSVGEIATHSHGRG